MDAYDLLPDAPITPQGDISKKLLELGIKTFRDAYDYIHNVPYGYNSNYEDKFILFKENLASCTMKHAIISGLAAEHGIPIYKNVGVYRFTEDIVTGAGKICDKYKIPYIPMVHCYLTYKTHRFDLTEGNLNGKKKPIENFIHTERVDPFISRKDEYLLFTRVVKEKVLTDPAMKGVKKYTIMKAHEEAIVLLHEKAGKPVE